MFWNQDQVFLCHRILVSIGELLWRILPAVPLAEFGEQSVDFFILTHQLQLRNIWDHFWPVSYPFQPTGSFHLRVRPADDEHLLISVCSRWCKHIFSNPLLVVDSRILWHPKLQFCSCSDRLILSLNQIHKIRRWANMNTVNVFLLSSVLWS